jgi:hypothetical protein
MKTEYPPYIIAGGWRSYFLTDGSNSSVASHPNSMVDASELNFKDNGSPPAYVVLHENAAIWKRDYYSVYSAQYVNHPVEGPVSIGFPEGENTHQPSTNGTISPCDWMNGAAHTTYLSLAWTPNTLATNWGHQLFTDKGPIIWPAAGYFLPDGTKSSVGCANNTTIQDGGYLYVFYNDQSCEAISAQMGPGRLPGIRVARAPISDCLNPHAYKTFYEDGSGVHWNESLPAGLTTINMDLYLDVLGPQGTRIVGNGSESNRGYNRFAVAKVVGGSTSYWLGLGWYQDWADGGKQKITLKYSPDLLHWYDDRVIYSADNAVVSQFNYPIFLSADGWSNTTIDEDNFYIIGTQPETSAHIQNIVYKKRIYIPPPTPPIQPGSPIACNWYMYIGAPSPGSYDFSGATLGDIDVTGNKLTIEALFNTESYDNATDGGMLVSKHCNSTDANYFLRPKSGGITTTDGYFQINLPCDMETNTTNHVAMVYDGAHLSMYRNGILQASIEATGNLVTNDYQTTVGIEACATPWSNPVSFRGYIGEVRISRRAKTEQELRQYYNVTIGYAYSDPDLLGYFTFNSTANQGTYPGPTGANTFGNASINQTNTSCSIDYVGCFGFARTANSITQQSAKGAVASSPATHVVVYPNPASKTATLIYSGNVTGTVTINVTDVTGKMVKVMKSPVMKGSNTINIDLNSLSNGVYSIQIIDGKNTQTKKLVISK